MAAPAGCGRRHLRAAPATRSRAAQLADVLGELSQHALLAAEEHRFEQRRAAARGVVDAGSGRERQREHAARRRRRDVRDDRRRSPHGHGARRAHRPADLAIHAAAESPQPVRDRCPSTAAWRSSAIVCSSARNDAALICLDARTGSPLWEIQIADTMEGYNITSPPLIVKDKVIVGLAGAEYPIRGFLDAYDVDRQAAVAVLHDSRARASSATTPGRATAGRPAADPRG